MTFEAEEGRRPTSLTFFSPTRPLEDLPESSQVLIKIHPPIAAQQQQPPGEGEGEELWRKERRIKKSPSCGGGDRHGEITVLREGAHEQGCVDQGGRRPAHCVHQGARRGLLALSPQGRRTPPLRQELPPPVDQLPPARPQARQLHRGRRRADHQAPQPLRQQMVTDSWEVAGKDRQRDQELLEHSHQKKAAQPGDRPGDTPADQRERVQHNHIVRGSGGEGRQGRRVPARGAEGDTGAS